MEWKPPKFTKKNLIINNVVIILFSILYYIFFLSKEEYGLTATIIGLVKILIMINLIYFAMTYIPSILEHKGKEIKSNMVITEKKKNLKQMGIVIFVLFILMMLMIFAMAFLEGKGYDVTYSGTCYMAPLLFMVFPIAFFIVSYYGIKKRTFFIDFSKKNYEELSKKWGIVFLVIGIILTIAVYIFMSSTVGIDCWYLP